MDDKQPLRPNLSRFFGTLSLFIPIIGFLLIGLFPFAAVESHASDLFPLAERDERSDLNGVWPRLLRLTPTPLASLFLPYLSLPEATPTPTPTPDCVPGDIEPNNAAGALFKPVCLDLPFDGTLDGDADRNDVYLIDMTASGALDVDLSQILAGTSLVMTFYDGDGGIIAHYGSVTGGERVTFFDLTSGAYFLLLRLDQAGSGVQPYRLQFSPIYDATPTPIPSATPISSSTPVIMPSPTTALTPTPSINTELFYAETFDDTQVLDAPQWGIENLEGCDFEVGNGVLTISHTPQPELVDCGHLLLLEPDYVPSSVPGRWSGRFRAIPVGDVADVGTGLELAWDFYAGTGEWLGKYYAGCSLHLWNNESAVFFSFWDFSQGGSGGPQTSLYKAELTVPAEEWVEIILTYDPADQRLSCVANGETVGSFQPEQFSLIESVPYNRRITSYRMPNDGVTYDVDDIIWQAGPSGP